MRKFFRISIGLALLSLLLIAGLVIAGQGAQTGPFVIGFFVLMALGFHGYSLLKGFAYSLWIFAAVSLAMYYPQYFISWRGFELKGLIVPLLQIIMFGMGTALSVKDFVGVVKMPRGVLIGMFLQFSIMPFLGYGLALSFGFPPEIAAGIILVGSSPSGLASNVMSYLARANLALSVTLTAVATLLAPLITPLWMKVLADQFVPIDFWAMMSSIIKIVIIPIIAGLVFNRIVYSRSGWLRQASLATIAGLAVLCLAAAVAMIRFTPWFMSILSGLPAVSGVASVLITLVWILLLAVGGALLFNKLAGTNTKLIDDTMPLISMIGIGFIILVITAAGRDSLLEIGLALIAACLIHNLAGYFLGYWSCRLLRMDERSSRTIALEVGMQNAGLASGIALTMGKVATIGLAPAVFGPMMNITGSSMATWWRGRPVAGEEEDEAETSTSQSKTEA